MKISVIIIAINEEKKIGDCLESVNWADEIILIDTGSTDKTKLIAKKYKAKIYDYGNGSYDKWRNEGLKKAKGEWVFYVDADERVTPLLKNEIFKTISVVRTENAFVVPRRNIILGREMKHGGWWPDYVKRLFRRKSLRKWVNSLHEEPVFEGSFGYLHEPLIHFKHTSLSEMVDKTNKWSKIEAKLLLDSAHPRMSWWRFVRIMATEGWLRLIKNQAFLDGTEGIIYAIYQMWSRFITYSKLWEMQTQYKKGGLL